MEHNRKFSVETHLTLINILFHMTDFRKGRGTKNSHSTNYELCHTSVIFVTTLVIIIFRRGGIYWQL